MGFRPPCFVLVEIDDKVKEHFVTRITKSARLESDMLPTFFSALLRLNNRLKCYLRDIIVPFLPHGATSRSQA